MRFQDLSGQKLGQYELQERLGVGGMGAVYRAYQPSLKRDVAVKVISTILAENPEAIKRFNREAEIVAKLEHPHIVPIHDYGTDEDISYVVMRLLTGGSLAERLLERIRQKRPLPSLTEIANLLRQLTGAIDYAHQRGVIHRDIKTNNIMFDDIGTAFLVDFGIAKMLDTTSSITGTGLAMGTPSHMSPEQWRGEGVRPASDQYSLGIVIYALVTGKLPFDVDTPHAMMHKHLTELPPPAHEIRADIPEAVGMVLAKVLAKNPAERFETVTAFMQAFTQAIGTQSFDEDTTDFFTFALSPKGVPPPYIPLVKTANEDHRTVTAEPQLISPSEKTDSVTDPSGLKPIDNDLTVPVSYQTMPHTPAVETVFGGVSTALPDPTVSMKTNRGRRLGLILAILLVVMVGIVFMMTEQANDDDLADVSQDTTAPMAPLTLTQTVTLTQVPTNPSPTHTLTATKTPIITPSILAGIDATTVASVEEVAFVQRTGVRSVAWYQDNLVISDEEAVVIFEDRNFARSVLVWNAHPEPITAVAFSYDGTLIATASEDNRVRVWDSKSALLVATMVGHTNDVYSVAFSPDDRMVASCGVDGVVRLWDTQTGENIAELRGHTRSVEKLHFSHDGRYLVTASADFTARVWDIETYETLRVLEGHQDYVLGVALSPDGTKLVTGSADRSMRVWDVETGTEIAIVPHPSGFVLDIAFSPNGTVFASAGADGIIRVWDVNTYELIKTLRGHTEGVNSIAFNEQGDLLASGSVQEGALRIWGFPSE